MRSDESSELPDHKLYREIVGSLIYAMTASRPDIFVQFHCYHNSCKNLEKSILVWQACTLINHNKRTVVFVDKQVGHTTWWYFDTAMCRLLQWREDRSCQEGAVWYLQWWNHISLQETAGLRQNQALSVKTFWSYKGATIRL